MDGEKELSKILLRYGIKYFDTNGNARTAFDLLDDIYLLLSKDDIICIMDEIEENSLEIFGEKYGN
jgi:hypothetical protein